MCTILKYVPFWFTGLLNLDISWCYLRIGNLNELPNAQERLKECENNFKKSYGENLERVMALKGNSSSEAVLYVRLHLLQGILDLNFLLLWLPFSLWYLYFCVIMWKYVTKMERKKVTFKTYQNPFLGCQWSPPNGVKEHDLPYSFFTLWLHPSFNKEIIITL